MFTLQEQFRLNSLVISSLKKWFRLFLAEFERAELFGFASCFSSLLPILKTGMVGVLGQIGRHSQMLWAEAIGFLFGWGTLQIGLVPKPNWLPPIESTYIWFYHWELG